jgi:2-oxoglutarate ferredoxin oxidoreductase subunit delta
MTAAPTDLPEAQATAPLAGERNLMSETTKQTIPAPKLAKRPLSAPQMLKLRNVDVVVIEDRCKGCSFCIEFCPKDVLEQDTKLNVRGAHLPRVKDSTLCVGCGICEEICPDFAIFLVEKGEKQ